MLAHPAFGIDVEQGRAISDAMKFSQFTRLATIAGLALALLAVIQLEAARRSIEIDHLDFGQTPVTIYQGQSAEKSLVIVSHGFAGSRQMMEAISLTLARAGHVVVSFDYLGHGRHDEALSRDIHSLTGTTEDLVEQTLEVINHAGQLIDAEKIALVGHSMATDVVIRAVERLPQVKDVVAISMYSDAVTAEHPRRLLIVSGARETRLREVALQAIAQIDPRAEGETVVQTGVERRAVAAPWVGHVGVLWSATTLTEVADWLGNGGHPKTTGLWIAVLLASIVGIFWPLAKQLPRALSAPTPTARMAVMASIIASPVAFMAGLSGLSALGLASFGGLAVCFGVWGVVVLLVLRPQFQFSNADVWTGLALIIWGIGIFAFAMDRYAAAFVPSGQRVPLMALLILPMIAFALADRVMVHGRHPVIRMLLRLPFIAALLCAMIVRPDGIGLLFTVLPVLVLFFSVYGTMAAWAARERGLLGVGIASGVILAWSIAASTPLFSAN